MSEVVCERVHSLNTTCSVALTALGDYDGAAALFRQIARAGEKSRLQFRDWCVKYVFDALGAGRAWHPADRVPAGAAFLPMVEADQMYRALSAKGRRLITDGFSARWSPDGKKLAFSAGVHGYSGIAVSDLATNQTDLLIFPGKDPRWSPDGKYVAFAAGPRFPSHLGIPGRPEAGAAPVAGRRGLAHACRWHGTPAAGAGKLALLEPGFHVPVLSVLRGPNPLFDLYHRPRATPRTDHALSVFLRLGVADNQRVAYFDEGVLRVRDMTSQKQVVECPMPFAAWADTFWSPTGKELYLGGGADYLGGGGPAQEAIGLWTYDLGPKGASVPPSRPDPQRLPVAPGHRTLAFCLGPPYFEIWMADSRPEPRHSRVTRPGTDTGRARPRDGRPLDAQDRGRIRPTRTTIAIVPDSTSFCAKRRTCTPT